MKKIVIILLLFPIFLFAQRGEEEFMLSQQQATPSGSSTPVYESTTTNEGTGTSINVTYPSGVVENDVVLLQAIYEENATGNIPSGFSEIHNSTDDYSIAGYWIRAGSGGLSGDVTFTTNGSGSGAIHVALHRFSGCKTSGAPFEDNQNQVAAFQGEHIIQEMTSSGANRLAIGMVMIGDNRTQTIFPVDYGNPAGTPDWEDKSTQGSDSWLQLYSLSVGSVTVPSNTCEFDQTERGGTINFLLLPQ